MHSNVVAFKSRLGEAAGESLTLLVMCAFFLSITSNKLRKNCAGMRKDASGRQSHDRQKGPMTGLKRIIASILTKEKQFFYRKDLVYDAMSGAMVQA